MENNNNVRQATPHQDNENSISLREIVFLIINNWYWFAISAIICILIALFIYKSTPKAYTTRASILLRDEGKKNSYGSKNMDAIFASMGAETGTTIENEIYIIKSSPLMTNVVRRMSLNNTCSRNSLFHKEIFFGNNPLQLIFYNRSTDNPLAAISVEVTPKNNGVYSF